MIMGGHPGDDIAGVHYAVDGRLNVLGEPVLGDPGLTVGITGSCGIIPYLSGSNEG